MSDPRFPEALPTDSEDVSWALSTGQACWARGDQADAVRWVKRASDSAADAGDDDRAFALARAAAELKQAAGIGATVAPPAAPPAATPPSPRGEEATPIPTPPQPRKSGTIPPFGSTPAPARGHAGSVSTPRPPGVLPRPTTQRPSSPVPRAPEELRATRSVSAPATPDVHDRITLVSRDRDTAARQPPPPRGRLDTPTEVVARDLDGVTAAASPHPATPPPAASPAPLGALEVWATPSAGGGVRLSLRRGPRPEGALDAVIVVHDCAGLEALLLG